MTCKHCNLTPCACGYIGELMEGKHGTLLTVAQAQSKLPTPHRDACPCPACWSARMASFKVVGAQ